MSTFRQIIYHIVFSTKNRSKCLQLKGRPLLFKYITGILKNKNCHLYQINGVEDHIHLLIELHPSISLSNLIKDIKLATSKFIKENLVFEQFAGWQDGYGAFTLDIQRKDGLIEYILNQEVHHFKKSYREELISLLHENQIEYDEKFIN